MPDPIPLRSAIPDAIPARDSAPEPHSGFVVVAPPGLDRDWVAACLRKLEPPRSLRFAEPTAPPSRQPLAAPELVVIDLDAPGAMGATTVRAFAGMGARIAAISGAEDYGTIDDVLAAGACAFIPRSYTEAQMLDVLRLALSGAGHRPYFPGRTARDAGLTPDAPQSACDPILTDANAESRLTPKQVEVLSLAADGLSNRQIAIRLGISEGTVKLHMSAIYLKLNVERRAEAIVLARRLEEVRAQQMHRAERGDEVLNWLLPHVTHRHARSGEVLFHKGDDSDKLYYIQRGRILLPEIGIERGAGEVFGEIGLFAPQHARTCSVVCVTDVELFTVSSEQVKSIYYLNPQFALHIVQLIAQRLLADQERER